MTLLAPLFLAGLAAVALPIWLHRLKTQSPETEPFSSTMLLEASEQRVHVRRELRYWLLLCLRVALLVLLALAFAQPVWNRPPRVLSGAAPSQHLILVDTSLSMGHAARMATARDVARGILRDAAEIDRLQLVAAGSALDMRIGPTREPAALEAAIAGLRAGYDRVDLGSVIGAVGSLVDPQLAADERIHVHLITDLQASSLPTRFADLVPAPVNGRPVALTLHAVAETDVANWSIAALRATAQGFEVGVRSHAGSDASVAVTLLVNGKRHAQHTDVVAAGGQALFRFAPAELGEGDNRVVARLTPGDELAADDVRYLVVDNGPPAPVLLLTRDKAGLPVTYLSTALAAIPGGYAAEPVHVADLDPRTLPRYPWLVIDDLGIVGERLADALTEYVRGGGNVLAALGDAALERPALPLTGHQLAEIAANAAGVRAVTRIELTHPALAATRGWRGVSVAQGVPISPAPEDRMLVGLSDGQPLLLERTMGNGHILLLTTRLDNAWSDLPVQPVFVNFVAEAASYLSGADRLERHQTAGSLLALQQSGGASGQVIDPQGNTVLTLAGTRRAADIQLSQTGFYEVYTPKGQALVAVNPDGRESDLSVMTAAQRAAWQDLLNTPPPDSTAMAAAATVETAPLAIWHGVLIVLALIVLAESLLGNGYLGQRRGVA